MSYTIVFTGEINPAFTQSTVVNNLAVLFKKDSIFIEKLFRGKPVTIKRDLELESAKKYHTAMNNAGAVAQLIDQETNEPVTDNKPGKEVESGTPTSKPEMQPTVLTAAAPGEIILNHTMPPEPDINISHLSMSEAGEQLVQPEIISPAIIDTSKIDLSASGSILSDEKMPGTPDIDTSKISLADTDG